MTRMACSFRARPSPTPQFNQARSLRPARAGAQIGRAPPPYAAELALPPASGQERRKARKPLSV
jgi:hypothetical protein